MELDEDVVEAQKQPSRKLQRYSDDVVRTNWNNPSSRIIRVSRASGGKDRHSKVLTSKGLRDRRIRLSVSTAIQFYDLQDRLGFDQPSKAVEWLISKAADSISGLPSINTNFDDQNQNQNQTKSACSSGTSESSLLSLSRTEIRGKARERARERTAKDKEKDLQNTQSSFTQLLTGGFDEPAPNWTGSVCYNPVQLIPNSSLHQFNTNHHHHRQEPSHQSPLNQNFVTDFNFGISSSDSPGAASINGGSYGTRGTLQSNSQSFFLNNNNQRSMSSSSSSPMDNQGISFLMATPPQLDHHSHQRPTGFDGRLYLNYGSSDDKAKERR